MIFFFSVAHKTQNRAAQYTDLIQIKSQTDDVNGITEKSNVNYFTFIGRASFISGLTVTSRAYSALREIKSAF